MPDLIKVSLPTTTLKMIYRIKQPQTLSTFLNIKYINFIYIYNKIIIDHNISSSILPRNNLVSNGRS